MESVARKPYPSDLTDAQWELMEVVIPAAQAGGRPRGVDMREVVNAILYLTRAGCQWDMLPHDLPAKSTVYDYFAAWRDDGTWQRMLDVARQAYRQGHAPSQEATPSERVHGPCQCPPSLAKAAGSKPIPSSIPISTCSLKWLPG